MSDPNTHFLAAVGRMAEASGNTPTAAPPDFRKRYVYPLWQESQVFPYEAAISVMDRHLRAIWEAAQSSLAAQLSAMEAAKNAAITLAHEREVEIKRLREALTECADSLEAGLKRQYDGLLGYPTMRADYDADMSVVTDARAALAQTPEGTHETTTG